jgi:hypothetical protein
MRAQRAGSPAKLACDPADRIKSFADQESLRILNALLIPVLTILKDRSYGRVGSGKPSHRAHRRNGSFPDLGAAMIAHGWNA